jgi:hypothetical protein
MVGLTVLLVLYWQLAAKRSFLGPSKADEAALRKIEEAFGKAG